MIEKLLARLAGFSSTQLIVVAALATGFYYFTSFDDGSTLKASIAASKTKLNEVETKNAEVRRLVNSRDATVEELSELTNGFQAVMKKLPAELNEPELISIIGSTAQRSEVKVSSIRSEEPIDFKFYGAIPINVEIQGKFSQLVSFLYLLAKYPRILRLENLSLKRAATGRDVSSEMLVLSGKLLGYKYYTDREIGKDADAE